MGSESETTRTEDRAGSKEKAKNTRDDRRPTRTNTPAVIDGMLESLEVDAHGRTGTAGPVDSLTHRAGLIQQVSLMQGAIMESVNIGVDRGVRAIWVPEIARSSQIPGLLGFAASAVFAGAAGGVGLWVARGIADKLVNKVFADAVKATFKSAFGGLGGHGSYDLDDLQEAFHQEMERQKGMATRRLAVEWSSLHDRLHALSDKDMAAVSDHFAAKLGEDAEVVHNLVADQTVIAWTNFLARAQHGAMSGWDPWERNGSKGAIKLDGAAAPGNGAKGSDPTHGNVDPRAIGPKLANNQQAEQEDHSGMLEIFLTASGALLRAPGYGIQLENVGPKVRARLRTLGRVRDLKVNKIVRLCSTQITPPVPFASVLITADGYVRSANWSKLQTLKIKHHEAPGPRRLTETRECFDDLIHGRESADCHIDRETDGKNIASLAEKAQDLPLTLLEA